MCVQVEWSPSGPSWYLRASPPGRARQPSGERSLPLPSTCMRTTEEVKEKETHFSSSASQGISGSLSENRTLLL